MTQKILGLDLGTNSIGSSVRNLDLSDDLKGQLEFFLLIFSEVALIRKVTDVNTLWLHSVLHIAEVEG